MVGAGLRTPQLNPDPYHGNIAENYFPFLRRKDDCPAPATWFIESRRDKPGCGCFLVKAPLPGAAYPTFLYFARP